LVLNSYTNDEVSAVRESLGIDIRSDEYAKNLERLMEVLFSAQFILKQCDSENFSKCLVAVDALILKINMNAKEQWKALLSSQRIGRNSPQGYESIDREAYERDFDRIIFSSAFRRMKDKTQVFPLSQNDYVRTRLTHSLEVSSVARSLGRRLYQYLEQRGELPDSKPSIPSIVSAACLAHDIGNPPFGHSGEFAIQAWAEVNVGSASTARFIFESEQQVKDMQHFEGNAQGLRVVTEIQERRREGGMQLTYATLGAMMKYPCSSLVGNVKVGPVEKKKFGYFAAEQELIVPALRELGLTEYEPGAFRRHPLAYLVEAADDICYAIIDLEDSVDQRIVKVDTAIQLLEPIAKLGGANLSKNYEGKQRASWLRAFAIHALTKECWKVFESNLESILEGKFHRDLMKECKAAQLYSSVTDEIKSTAYKDSRVLQIEAAGFQVIGGLLDLFVPALKKAVSKGLSSQLLSLFQANYIGIEKERVDELTDYQRVLIVTDYISGMTDRFAVDLYQKLSGIKLPS
jgi:dGTPase